MSSDLEIEIRIIHKQQGGRLSKELEPEFIKLCQQDFNYRPDTSCGNCIYKHSIKLYNKYFK